MTVELEAELLSVLACPGCGSGVRSDGDDIVCEGCGLHYPVRDDTPIMLAEAATDGQVESDYARRAKTDTESIEFYDAFYKEFNDYRRYEKADVDFTRKLFRRLSLPPRARVLDLGSGTGYFHSLIETLTGHDVYSADFSFEGFRAAREHYKLRNLVVMDAYRLAFAPDTLDAILTIGLTPFKKGNSEEIVELIERIITPLRSGGYYVFIWSTNLSGRVRQSSAASVDGKMRSSPYYNHSRRSIREAFRATGQFDEIRDYAFIRPLSHLFDGLLLTRANTWLTDLVMKVTPPSLSARLLVIGRRA